MAAARRLLDAAAGWSGRMKARKIALRFGFAMILLSGAGVGAPEFEAELDSSGGSTVGGWSCGPAARVNYAGIHGHAQIAERHRHDPEGPGYTAELGVGAESQNNSLAGIPRCGSECSNLPPDRALWAGQLRAGYRSEDLGLMVGSTLYQGWYRHTDATPTLGWCPDLEFSLGPRKRWYVAGGLGSGLATTLHRPGIYFGGGVATEGGYRLELFTGVFRQGPTVETWWPPNNNTGRRANLIGWAPLSPNVDLRLGAGLEIEPGRPGGEGSVGARFYF